jgi:hypothetical protein
MTFPHIANLLKPFGTPNGGALPHVSGGSEALRTADFQTGARP